MLSNEYKWCKLYKSIMRTALTNYKIRMRTSSRTKKAKGILKRASFVLETAKSPLPARTRKKWEKISLFNLSNYLLRTAKETLVVVEWRPVKIGSKLHSKLRRKLTNYRNPSPIISSLINNQRSNQFLNNMPKIYGSTQLAKKRMPMANSSRVISTWLWYMIII